MVLELLELGFTESEAKVYVALLELGASPVSVIAKKAGLNRVGCYHTLDKLVEKGLANFFMKGKVKYFVIETPELLVKKKQEDLSRAKKVLPELMSITNSLSYKPKIQYYEGVEGVKKVFEDGLEAEGEMIGYTNFGKLLSIFDNDYMREYMARRVEKNLKLRMLSPNTAEAVAYSEKFYREDFDKYLVEIFFVNPDEFMFDYEIRIYGDRVSIVSLHSDELMAWVIHSGVYAKTQRAIFNLAWLGATSFVAK